MNVNVITLTNQKTSDSFFLYCHFLFHRNQEHLEHLKKSIADKQVEENEFLLASNRSKSALNSIKLTIIDLIHKLQEVFVATGSMEMETNENAPNHVILEVGKIESIALEYFLEKCVYFNSIADARRKDEKRFENDWRIWRWW